MSWSNGPKMILSRYAYYICITISEETILCIQSETDKCCLNNFFFLNDISNFYEMQYEIKLKPVTPTELKVDRKKHNKAFHVNLI